MQLREQGMLLDAINGSEYDVLRGLRPLMTGTLLQAYKQQGADTSYYARLSPSPIGCWMSTGYPVSPRCREPAIWRWRMKLCAITLCKTKSALMNWSFLAPLTVMDNCSVDVLLTFHLTGRS